MTRDSGSSGCSCSGPEEPERTDPPELDLPAPPPHSPADAAPATAGINSSTFHHDDCNEHDRHYYKNTLTLSNLE